ncbi:c-type cytochrome [Pseudomonas cremoricolorata]|uniref:Cytochrome C n=1 Tax=Pseudomonas cremoricolorata TaxID=157783 RepID=A0A089WGC7_9PSED|nr:cytochrome c [Pseudomonas cremoricolorata]AIR88370.1 cytochrome C [Pseudomonas cremoricolorata]
MFKRFTAMLCITLFAAGCDRVDPDSPVAKRKAIFKDMLHTSENLGGMLRGRLPFDAAGFADGAGRLDALAHEPWQHFAKQAEGGDSSARPELWQRQARFEDLARRLEASTAVLREQTRQQAVQPASLQAPMNAVEAACKACHQEFRNH